MTTIAIAKHKLGFYKYRTEPNFGHSLQLLLSTLLTITNDKPEIQVSQTGITCRSLALTLNLDFVTVH